MQYVLVNTFYSNCPPFYGSLSNDSNRSRVEEPYNWVSIVARNLLPGLNSSGVTFLDDASEALGTGVVEMIVE
jgi:hypothetical protein